MMGSTEWFNRIWDIPPNAKTIVMEPIDYTWWYGKNQKLTPVLKGKCSYCGLSMEGPQIQHSACVKLQIEVEKSASKQ